jgi:hypothetical protein
MIDINNINDVLSLFDEHGPNKLENSVLIEEQYRNALERNSDTELDGLAQVFFVDRETDPNVVEIRGIWFNSDGERVDRPDDKLKIIKHKDMKQGENNND